MSARIVLTGFGENEIDAAASMATVGITNAGAAYPVQTFEANENQVWTEGEGVARAIDFPALRRYLDNWGALLVEVSHLVRDTMVTILVDGEVQAAINGRILK